MFWKRFYNLCEWKNTKPLQVVKELNIAAGSITKWKNGAIPSGINLCLIANYFEVSIDYLMGITDFPFQERLNPNFRKLLEQENGELKLKIYFMMLGLPEIDAERDVELAKWRLEFLKEMENGMPEREALEKYFAGAEFDVPDDENDESSKASSERWNFNLEHPEVRLNRAKELMKLLGEEKD